MKRVLCTLAIAAAAAGASMTASADTRAYVTVTPAPVYERHSGPPAYAYESHEYDHRHRRSCDAPRWDPNHRYMPGESVRRNGEVFVATETSRHVYNVNSPPEWTPNYWAPARCR
ncbi:MAG TPA: hypothetical protein VMZ74_14620 [Ramlibacter sp.]|nr:hypothetical protein [Ramlibacter sp.]